MIAAVESVEPPLRLLLGSDAIAIWEKKQPMIATDLARRRQVGERTASDGVTVGAVGG